MPPGPRRSSGLLSARSGDPKPTDHERVPRGHEPRRQLHAHEGDPMATHQTADPIPTISTTLPTLRTALMEVERDVAEFFGSPSPEVFDARTGEAWSPAEHLSHLNIRSEERREGNRGDRGGDRVNK